MRKIFFLPIAIIFATGASAALAAQNDDLLIVPGERVGAITRDASEESLRAIYGDDRVESVLVGRGEGLVCKGSRILFQNGEFLEITWLDVKSKATPDAVYINGASWRTGDGIGLGTSLRELETLNGKPFLLVGFEWDYGGTVISWDGGRLETSPRGMVLALIPDGETYQRVSVEEAEQVAGDSEFSSAHPVMQKLNPRLRSLTVFLNRSGRCTEFSGE